MRRLVLLLALLLPVLAAPAGAQERSLRVRDFDVRLEVRPDGTVDVAETLRVEFRGQWNGIFRDLALKHETGQGHRERLRIRGLRVADAAGQPLEAEEVEGPAEHRRLRIRVPGARDAERTVVIRYTLANAVRFFYGPPTGDLDELYWNATGNQWEIPIDRASVDVVLPAGAAPLQSAVYTGYDGAAGRDAKVASKPGVVSFTSTRPFAPGEGMTVAVGWAPGAVASRPSAAEMQRRQRMRWWPLGIPLLVFAAAFRYWRRHGRDPEAQAVVVGYEPPEGLSPAELGTLVDNRAHMRDITSTLVDLAVRGHLGIEERKSAGVLGLFRSRDYVFHLRGADGKGPLAPHEQGFLSALGQHATASGRTWGEVRAAMAAAGAGGGGPAEPYEGRETRQVRMEDLKERFYSSLPGIRNAIYDRLVERGYYVQRPDRVQGAWIGMAIVGGGLGIVAAFLSAEFLPALVSPLAVGAAAVASAVMLLGFGAVMPARTVRGARVREAALGFREFLARVESERYRRMVTSPEMFERYLPHALAFGVAERWAGAFEEMYREPPSWYAGGSHDGFRAGAFTSDLVRMNTAAQSTMSSSPSSSGSGGGGSSGGGSGGGGGGGW